jgi:hypothetical protein
MSQLQTPRDGSVLQVKHQEVPFSLWPATRDTRRFKLQSRIFTSDPWSLMAEGIADVCPKKSKEAAHAFRAQAEDFFDAAIAMGSRNLWAKPLLLYYAFLNLSRAYLLTWGYSNPTERPQHGIAEKARIRQVEGTRLTVHPSGSKKPQLFDQLLKALTGHGLKARKSYRLGYLMPQILFGHRVWCSASDENERFNVCKRQVHPRALCSYPSGDELSRFSRCAAPIGTFTSIRLAARARSIASPSLKRASEHSVAGPRSSTISYMRWRRVECGSLPT